MGWAERANPNSEYNRKRGILPIKKVDKPIELILSPTVSIIKPQQKIGIWQWLVNIIRKLLVKLRKS